MNARINLFSSPKPGPLLRSTTGSLGLLFEIVFSPHPGLNVISHERGWIFNEQRADNGQHAERQGGVEDLLEGVAVRAADGGAQGLRDSGCHASDVVECVWNAEIVPDRRGHDFRQLFEL